MRTVPFTVARTEFRRTVRSVTADRTKLLLLALFALFVSGSITAAGGYLLPSLGEHFATSATAETTAIATEIASGGAAVGWLALVGMAAIRAFTAATDPDESAFLLVSTSVRNVTVGVVLAELLLFGVWLLPPTILLSRRTTTSRGRASRGGPRRAGEIRPPQTTSQRHWVMMSTRTTEVSPDERSRGH